MIIVPSILPSSNEEAVRSLRRLSRSDTLSELRIDGITDPRPGMLLERPRPPLIVTCRRRAEGGAFNGTARRAAALLLESVRCGAEYVDAEKSLGASNLGKLFDAAGRRRIILSYHNPRTTPGDLMARFRKMASMKPALVKIAVTARSVADTGRILDVLAEARRRRQPVSAIAMGEYGVYTRILQGVSGGALTYAADDALRPTAAGQVSMSEMLDLYRAGRLNARTKIFGLLGNPVRYSRGILYHNGIFSRGKKNAVYLNFAADDAGAFMRILGPRITGLSVTMPFKSSIRPFLDRLEGSAAMTGAVNTVLKKPYGLLGLNTDFHAFLTLLKKRTRIAGKRMLVLGTGSTAATAAGAGIISGARVFVSGRHPRKARALAERFGCGWMPASDLPSAGCEIIVNATPVGMTPHAAGHGKERIITPATLRGCRVVCDFANPPSGLTRLVADARRHGCRVITGEQIFTLQAGMQSVMFLGLT